MWIFKEHMKSADGARRSDSRLIELRGEEGQAHGPTTGDNLSGMSDSCEIAKELKGRLAKARAQLGDAHNPHEILAANRELVAAGKALMKHREDCFLCSKRHGTA
jgi:hypothetical protein